MSTPYVTPQMITNAPTGISWSIIPFPKSNTAQQVAEQTNICWRATGMVDAYCNQVLRATVDTERLNGPDFRLTMQPSTGNARLMLSRWPITQVLQVAISPNTFPRIWQVVPSGYFEVERPPIDAYGSTSPSSAGDGGQSVLVSAGYVDWANGREGYTTATSYLNGWAHSSLTAAASLGAMTLSVDDVTSMTGARVFIYDGAETESVTVSSVAANANFSLPYGTNTVPAGPGTISLSTGTLFPHSASAVVSAMPQAVLWATVLACTEQALESGITAVSVQNLPGSQTTGGQGLTALEAEFRTILNPYRRVI
jgi:hypothetical protein